MPTGSETPLWFRDTAALEHLLKGAWEKVSRDFVKDLAAAARSRNYAKLELLLSNLGPLGRDMAIALKQAPDAAIETLLMTADAYWTKHAISAGLTKPVSLPEAYKRDMAIAHAEQIRAFAERFPARIIRPEVIRYINLMKDAENPDALAISGISDRLEMIVNGDYYWEELSAVQVGRIWNATGVSTAAANSIGMGRITGPMDDITCPVCRHLVGAPIDISDMQAKIESDLDIQDPDAYRDAWTFPRIDDLNGIDRAEIGNMIVKLGWLPPFHPHCRHSIAWLHQ